VTPFTTSQKNLVNSHPFVKLQVPEEVFFCPIQKRLALRENERNQDAWTAPANDEIDY